MKRNQVNDIFGQDTKRRRTIILYAIVISIIFALSFYTLFYYFNKSRVEYIKYSENSSAKYNVHLKENEFYKEDTLNEDNQYISELIDYISAQFSHNISVEKTDYKYIYSYRIEANAMVIENATGKNIYNYKETILSKKEFTSSDKDTFINENIVIDYNKYNELISKFIQTYSLIETDNILKVDLIVSMEGACDGAEESDVHESITTLEIPLTSRTVSIDTKSNLVSEDENVMLCIRPSTSYIAYLVAAIVLALIGILVLIRLAVYIVNSRTAKTVYDKELKRILNNYRSYIQKINNNFAFRGYQVLKVETFTDMLEIRDTTNQPILMVENGGKDSVYFVIPTATKILYTYGIRVSDIQKEMNRKDD